MLLSSQVNKYFILENIVTLEGTTITKVNASEECSGSQQLEGDDVIH